MRGRKKVNVIEEDFWDVNPEAWADEELESDAIDLQEWGFVYGYYGDIS